MNDDALKVIADHLFYTKGIIPIQGTGDIGRDGHTSISQTLGKMTKEDARKATRKFRKLWRKRNNSYLKASKNTHIPNKAQMTAWKVEVYNLIRREASKLLAAANFPKKS